MADDAGITRGGDSLNVVVWNVVDQTHRPVRLSAASFTSLTSGQQPVGTVPQDNCERIVVESVGLTQRSLDQLLRGG